MASKIIQRGRPLLRDGRERFLMFPRTGGGKRLYALGFADGRTKIGMCDEPRNRFVQHWIASEKAVTWVHLFAVKFGSGSRGYAAEQAAVKRAALVGDRIRLTETFHNLSRDQAIACVRAAIACT